MLRLVRTGQSKQPSMQGIDEIIRKDLHYEPSLDAVEWRVKFQELQSTYYQLCERIKSNSELQSAQNRAK